MFKPHCLPVLIGSLPLTNHQEAVEIILSNTPEVPLWPQLPKLRGEGMVRQFLTGFPGLQEQAKKFYIDTDMDGFVEEMAEFYEDYFTIDSDITRIHTSRFGLNDDTAAGFSTFCKHLRALDFIPLTTKGQVTGPVTTGIGTHDQHEKPIIYDDNLRDMLIKHLSLKARWQVENLKLLCTDAPPIIFIDEPAMVSFGSTGFMGVTKEMVTQGVEEVIVSIQTGGGLAGIHICANGDWSPALSSSTDIVSFDAYFYFDNFTLYQEEITAYLKRGGILAWGIIPTGDPEILLRVDGETLFSLWQEQLKVICSFGFSAQQVMDQTFISPSCGTGSLSPELAIKVLNLTREVSLKAQLLR